MIKHAFCMLLALILLITGKNGFGQQEYSGSSQLGSHIPAHRSLLLNRMVVYQRNGDMIGGFLVGIKADYLVLLVEGNNKAIPIQELSQVTLEVQKQRGKYGFVGLSAAVYLGNLICFHADRQPNAYLSSTDYEDRGDIFLPNILFAGAGALGALIAGNMLRDKAEFVFRGSPEENRTEWKRLQKFILQKRDASKIHLSFQAAQVFLRAREALEDLHGYSIETGLERYFSIGGDLEPAFSFNLLRKAQLTMSIRPKWAIGAALLWFGEPTILAFNDQQQPSAVRGVIQSLNSKGYLLVGVYKSTLKGVYEHCNWNVGLGTGVATIDFKRDFMLQTMYPFFQLVNTQTISKTVFSSTIFTELQLDLANNFTFGLAADYVFAASQQLPPLHDPKIPAQKIRLRNGSIGINIGLHF